MNFVAIDVETSNPDLSSICQIGLVKCSGGILSDQWKTYIDPQDYFDPINVSIHGITESMVRGAPTFGQLGDTLLSRLQSSVSVCHTHFDRAAINKAAQRHGVSLPTITWLDSAAVARRAWEECAWRGYGLENVCRIIGHSFRQHDALEDAKAAAHILLAAAEQTGLDIEGWLSRVRQPIGPASRATAPRERISRAGNPEGPLYGEVLVFTGTLSMRRREAADMAAAIGCQVAMGPTKETTILVVGDQDIKKLSGHNRSAKHRRVEEMIQQGMPIRILQESDFEELLRTSGVLA